MNTMPTTPIRIPAMRCSSPRHAPRHPAVRPNAFSQLSALCVLSGKGQAISRELAKPQQLKASWMRRIEAASFCLNKVCQRSRKPQFSPDGGAACVPSRVMTTLEYMKMRVLAMMTSGGRWIPPRLRPW